MTRLLTPEHIVRPATKGAFAIVPMWGGSNFELISPTTTARPFTVAAPTKPKPRQVFRERDAGPCILDLRGTVTPVDLPEGDTSRAQWHSDTSFGWLGWTDGGMRATTVYIQQKNGSFGSVEMTVPPTSIPTDVFFGGAIAPDGAILVTAGNNSGFSQVAVSADRGRTWQVRWPITGPFGTGDVDWRSLPMARNPVISIGRLQPVT